MPITAVKIVPASHSQATNVGAKWPAANAVRWNSIAPITAMPQNQMASA